MQDQHTPSGPKGPTLKASPVPLGARGAFACNGCEGARPIRDPSSGTRYEDAAPIGDNCSPLLSWRRRCVFPPAGPLIPMTLQTSFALLAANAMMIAGTRKFHCF
jgi:hypothetical protein